MSSLRPLPLGARIPDLPHAVSCSLPTLAAVVGYEEKDPAVTRHLTSGYPRFVKHPFLRQAADHVLAALGRTDAHFWPTAHAQASVELQAWLAGHHTEAVVHQGLHGVLLPKTAEAFSAAKTFLQHTGQLPCSREAEDYLVRVGLLPRASAEATYAGDAESHIRERLLPYLHPATERDVFLTANGINAVYAAFAALQRHQAERGRLVWIQLGWLYLDTISILQKFTGAQGANYEVQNNVFDFDALRALFARYPGRIAGVVTEVPTNPLIQTCDLPALAQLCRAEGAALIVDPSIASVGNVDVLAHCDLLVTSLTKFTAAEGDVIAGAVVVNPASEYAAAARAALVTSISPLYPREAARLATQVDSFAEVLTTINQSVPAIVKFLREHPRVDEVFWSQHPYSKSHYEKVSRGADAVGSLITFTVKGDLAHVYDRLRFAKGPSFGMRTTLICPFLYLAHYDMVRTEEGRAELRRHGLNPYLLRLSIGCEPVDELVEALREALA